MAMAIQHRVPDRVGACIIEDDDFVVVCTNRAVLDVGLLPLYGFVCRLIDPPYSLQVSNSIVIESFPF